MGQRPVELDAQAIADAYLDGATVKDLAERFRVSATPINRCLKEQQVPMRKSGTRLPREFWKTGLPVEQIKAARAAGDSTGVIAKRYGVTKPTILKLLKEAGPAPVESGVSMTDVHDTAQCETRLGQLLARARLRQAQEPYTGPSYPDAPYPADDAADEPRMLDGKQVRPRPKRFGDSPQTHDQLMEMREFFPRSTEGVRTANALMREGMVSVAQLRDTPLEQLVGIPDIASGRLAMIRALLEDK